jgi:hypothetical protein
MKQATPNLALQSEAPTHASVTPRSALRQHWIQADLHCLQCGRTLGRVAETTPRHGASAVFSPAAIFRSSEAPHAPCRINSVERLRCQACGGCAVISDFERFTTYNETMDLSDVERPRRGRPPTLPRYVPDHRLVELGLAV